MTKRDCKRNLYEMVTANEACCVSVFGCIRYSGAAVYRMVPAVPCCGRQVAQEDVLAVLHDSGLQARGVPLIQQPALQQIH
jgi:hypothetical protein